MISGVSMGFLAFAAGFAASEIRLRKRKLHQVQAGSEVRRPHLLTTRGRISCRFARRGANKPATKKVRRRNEGGPADGWVLVDAERVDCMPAAEPPLYVGHGASIVAPEPRWNAGYGDIMVAPEPPLNVGHGDSMVAPEPPLNVGHGDSIVVAETPLNVGHVDSSVAACAAQGVVAEPPASSSALDSASASGEGSSVGTHSTDARSAPKTAFNLGLPRQADATERAEQLRKAALQMDYIPIVCKTFSISHSAGKRKECVLEFNILAPKGMLGAELKDAVSRRFAREAAVPQSTLTARLLVNGRDMDAICPMWAVHDQAQGEDGCLRVACHFRDSTEVLVVELD